MIDKFSDDQQSSFVSLLAESGHGVLVEATNIISISPAIILAPLARES